MKTTVLLFLAASICLADDLPFLRQLDSRPIQGGLNLTAWSDTVAVVDTAFVAYYEGGEKGIEPVGTYTGRVASRAVRLFHQAGKNDLVATEAGIGALVRNGNTLTFRAALMAPSPQDFGGGYPTWVEGGEIQFPSTTGKRAMLNCLGGSRYLETDSRGAWQVVSTSGTYGTSPSAVNGRWFAGDRCDLDSSTGIAARIGWTNGKHWTVETGDPNPAARHGTQSFDAQRIDWILTGWNGLWLAMDQMNSGIVYYDRIQGTGTVVDSFWIPGLANAASSGAQVARVDSLVAFGSDSAIVLIKWKPDGSIGGEQWELPHGTIRAVALADSTLWVLTRTDLLRFRIAWPEPAASLADRHSSIERNLSIVAIDGGARLTWTGIGDAEIRVTDAAGRLESSIAFRSGQTRNWHAPSRGVYFASTPTGSLRLLVR